MSGLRILHLSDTHFDAEGSHMGIVDSRMALDTILEACSTLHDLDLIVVSGDVSDDGKEASYRGIDAILHRFAAERGRAGAAPILYAMGNHDSRGSYGAVFGTYPNRVLYGVAQVGALRVIVLDSSVENATYGYLDQAQLNWLREELATPAEAGTVVVVHHPPVPPVTPLHQGIGLQNPDELAQVLAEGDVRAVLAGHYHHTLIDFIGSIPVFVAPGVVNVNDVLAPEGSERAFHTSGAQLITLSANSRTVGARVLPVVVPNVDFASNLTPEQVREIDARIAAPSSVSDVSR